MNTYKVRFSSNAHPYDIQRETNSAESLEQLQKMYADTGCRILDVDIVFPVLEVAAYIAALDEPRNERYPASPFYNPAPMIETIQARQERLEKELAETTDKERALVIIDELAEIEAWYQKEMDFIGAEHEARRFGVGL